jgi:hypothetical protein
MADRERNPTQVARIVEHLKLIAVETIPAIRR